MYRRQMDAEAYNNMDTRFKDNPCRGIAIGMLEDGAVAQLTWIMERSDNSENRLYVVEGQTVRTEPADDSKVEDPRLIIYDAMLPCLGRAGHVIGNGDQTRTIEKALKPDWEDEETFEGALSARYCEPDAPIFTPRITGLYVSEENDIYRLSILRANPQAKKTWIDIMNREVLTREYFKKHFLTATDATKAFNQHIYTESGLSQQSFPTIRSAYTLEFEPGFGSCLTTYKPGSKTLDQFEGAPFLVRMKGGIEDVMQDFWNALEPEWRVSLAGKLITGDKVYVPPPINRFEKVQN